MNNIFIRVICFTSFLGLFPGLLHAQSDYKLAEQDSLALVAFYRATDGPNWKSNQDGFGFDDLTSEWQGIYDGSFNKWLDGPAKDWFGVKVEKRPIPNSSDSAYRVTWLWPVVGRRTDGQNFLDGYIPGEVAYLTALKQFRVNGNNRFEWEEIPDALYHKSLEHLDIEACWFGGGISDALRNCTGIRKMNFRYNNIDYMPTLDFLDADALYNLEGTQWWYSTRLSFAIIEKTIDYFYTISPAAKTFQIEARDLFDVGDEKEIVAATGSSVTLECVDAGEKEAFITYQWYKNGLSMFGKTARTLTISSVKESDYADYKVKITNDYVKEYDQNTNYGEVYTKPFHLVAQPVPPTVEWAKTSYNGKEITLRLSKPMNDPVAGFDGFAIKTGSATISALSARTEGRLDLDLVLTLSEPIYLGDDITIDYTGNQVADKNGGILAPFADTTVQNLVREAPSLVSAITARDGSGIRLVFDKYIDQNSINPGDFTVIRDGNGVISSATLAAGEIDDHISKTVLLTLESQITDSAEVIKVKCTRGELSGFLGGVVNTSDEIDVTNQVTVDLTEVLLYFEDGSRLLNDILIDASWKVVPIQMYDDGTNGDEVAGDHLWTTTVSLADDNYNWDVLSRRTVVTYDTVRYEDPETGIITLTVTPDEVNLDSLLSENVVLEFSVANKSVTGTTRFGIMNIPVTFILTMDHTSDQVYLMGIDDDWGLGIPLEGAGENFKYTTTVPGFSPGDIIRYNYRDGNIWENQTVEPRSYVVKSENNLVNDVFGVFIVSSNAMKESPVSLYPNPVTTDLYINGVQDYNALEIYNSKGHLVNRYRLSSSDSFICNVSGYSPGIYFVHLISGDSKIIIKPFIKK